MTSRIRYTGADPGGGAHPARALPKIGKNKIFWHKIVIFHTKYPKYGAFFLSAPPLTWNPGSAPGIYMFISLYLLSDWLRSTGNFVVNHLKLFIYNKIYI